MKKIFGNFVKGIVVLSPFIVSIYLFSILFKTVDGLGELVLKPILNDYVPGLGFLLTLAIIFIVGYLSDLWLSKKVIYLLDTLFTKIPLLKIVYETIKDTVNSFSGEKKSFSKVVRLQEGDAYRIAFLATEYVAHFDVPDDYVVVYIPHGMQISGEIKLVRKEHIVELDMSVKEALSFSLSAGVVVKK
ncbi:MAG: DUF502 domain-containing protein [Bacilli bacterium]